MDTLFGIPIGSSADFFTINVSVDGGGSAITTGQKGYVIAQASGVIVQASLVCDQTGSIVFDVWKSPFSPSALPTVANTITGAAKPTLSSAKAYMDSVLQGWSVQVVAGDIFGFNVDSASTVTKATLTLKVRKAS